MDTFNGLPAHILLVHFIVVLAPLTAILEIVCALWRPARSRLVWLVLALAAITLVLTPLTTDAGEWLEHQLPRSAAIHAHTELGDWMIYFSAGLALVALALAFVHLRENRVAADTDAGRGRMLTIAVAVLAIVVGVSTIIGVYRIGDSGAKAVWSDSTGTSQQ